LRCVIAHDQRLLRFRAQSLPKFLVLFRHEKKSSPLFA
jgi:hypothetical protein